MTRSATNNLACYRTQLHIGKLSLSVYQVQAVFFFSGIFCFFCFFLYKKPLFIRHIGVRHCRYCCHCIFWVRGYAANAYRSDLPSSGEFYSVSRSPSDMVSTGLATQLK